MFITLSYNSYLYLAFTRTLTILYSTTLLSLFTHIQLNTLGRSKYLQSIVQQAHEENMREQWRDSISLTSLLWSGGLEDAEIACCWLWLLQL